MTSQVNTASLPLSAQGVYPSPDNQWMGHITFSR